MACRHFDCLRGHNVAHVFNAWARMPALGVQMARSIALLAFVFSDKRFRANALQIGGALGLGVLVVAGGKIVAVGTADKIAIPAGAEIHDITGKVLMPGLVDSHSHIGSGSGGAVVCGAA